MTSEWRTADLIAEGILEIGDGYRAKNSELATSGLPFARAGNINNGFNFSDADLLGSDAVRAAGNKISQPGDVVFTSKGTVGRFAFVGRETPQFVYSPQLCYWRSKEQGVLHPRFLYYWMQSSEFLTQMAGVKGQTDMADYVSLRDQRAFKISVPAPAVQHQVASILSAYDDKIELNRRMNRTLEQMARALFKSWFVDFEPVRAKMRGEQPTAMDAETAALFPDELVEVDGREVPKGWKWQSIGDLYNLRGGSTPSTSNPDFWENGEVHWTSPKDLSGLDVPLLTRTEKKITDAGVRVISSGVLPAGTVLLSSRAPVGYLAITTLPVSINQGYIALESVGSLQKYFTLNLLQERIDEVKAMASGTTFPELSKRTFRTFEVLVPTMPLCDAYEEVVHSLYEALLSNIHESAKLSQIRDSLLPRLLSGELDITSWADETEQVSA